MAEESTLVATLKKVDAMASDRMEKWASAVDKLRELEELGYPVRVRREACGVVAAEVRRGDVGIFENFRFSKTGLFALMRLLCSIQTRAISASHR